MKDRIIYALGIALVLIVAVLLPITTVIADTNTTVSNQESISYPPKIDKIQGLLWTEILNEKKDGKLAVTAHEIEPLSMPIAKTRVLINLKVDLLNDTEKERALVDVEGYGASNIDVYKYVNAIGADFPIDKLDELASLDYIESILDADAQIFEAKLDDSIPAVKANYTYSLGLTGSGVRVAVLDTGIDHDTNLITIARDGNGDLLQYNASDGSRTNASTEDHNKHGTHVAGIVAAHRHQYNGRWLQGVVPGAEIVPVKVLNDEGSGSVEDVTNGIDWATSQNVDIIHMSLGSTLPDNYPAYWVDTWFVTDHTEEMAAVKNAVDRGVAVVISSGNEAGNHASEQLNQGESRDIHILPTWGNVTVDFYTQTKDGSFTIRVLDPNGNQVSQHNYQNEDNYLVVFGITSFLQLNQQWTLNITRNAGSGGDGRFDIIVGGYVDIVHADRDPFHTVTIPGNVEKAITVGAVDNNGVMAEFSSRGPSKDGGIKPDLVAPGVGITSLAPQPEDVDGHDSMSGTSMAAPHVSGAAAVFIQFYRELYNRELTPAEIKALLMGSAVDSNGALKGTIDNEYGAGILNVYAGYISSVAHDTVGGLILPDNDDDYNARVPTNAPAWLKVKGILYWDDTDDDIDLSLFNPSGGQVDSDDQSPPRITRIVSDDPTGGIWRYYIHGKAYGGLLDWDEEWYLGTPYPPNDAYEETTGIIHEGIVTKHNIEIPNNAEYLRVIVYWDDVNNNNIDIKLYDPTNNLVDYSNLHGITVEQVGAHSPMAGKWRLEINGTSITGAQEYSILSNHEAKEDPIEKGLQYLRTTQQGTPDPSDGDGSWSSDVGVTSLAAICFLNAGYDETDPDVRDAIGYIRSKVQGDGSIWSGSKTYHTSLATLALVATHNASYDATINNAAQWLKNSQWDEDCLWGTVNNDSWYYGGFGYGYHVRPDNSNTQFALMALDSVSSVSKDDLLWDKAQVFLARTQNRQENVNIPDIGYEVIWNPTYNKYDDGGFVYYPGASLAGDVNSYGSMTGAGIWGLRLSNVEKDDSRVDAALDWVIDNYMMDGNPGMGNPGTFQYYYYLSMSKALTMTEPDFIGGHNWYQDLSDNLTALQKPEGYWINERDTWCWEDNKDLVTSYAILSLQTRTDLPPPVKRLSWLTFILHSNADLHVYDPLGRHVGINYDTGEVEIQIPNATYTSNGEQNITVPHLEAGNYRIVLIGTGTGEYTLNVTGGVGNDTVSEDSFTSAISEGEVHDADVNVAMITWLTIHIEEPDPVDAIVESATGTGNVSFVTDAGTIEDLAALNESDLPEENPNVDFPHGLFSFNITGLSNGETVNVTIDFPENIPTTAEYWKYNASSGEWYQIPIGSNDGDNIIIITLQDGGIGDNDGVENGIISDPGAPGVSSAPPSAASTTPSGAPKNTYCVDENVYAAGSGFTPGTNVDIHVVQDRDWNDGDQIPQDVTGTVETVPVTNGDVGPVLVWHAPLTPGRYDIVIDANRNGVYDAATDGLDSGSPGFVVVADATIPAGVPVPALAPPGIIALVGLLCVIGVSRIRRRFN